MEWLGQYEALMWSLAAFSAVAFVGTLIAVPILVARIPTHYFADPKHRVRGTTGQNRVLQALLLVGKNALGAVFILMGLLMLVLPGQGLITLLFGIMLLNFPGKYRLERWVVSRRPVLRPVNWLRRRARRPPLEL
ncbi:hypothetical protein HUS23_06930 [Ectothiorhodospiraceae bacterium 2226]|nr:hypothetical protein HUS23_06930 [Ectothiorhodospiraceae bacterium 2226]